MPTCCLDRLELDLHLLAQLEVERAERLVEEEHLGPIDEGAGQGDALALAARELAGTPSLVALEANHAHGLRDARPSLAGGDAAHDQPVADVVADAHVREEGVVLEDGVDVAVEGWDAGDILAVEADRALGRDLEAGDHAQRRRLPRP